MTPDNTTNSGTADPPPPDGKSAMKAALRRVVLHFLIVCSFFLGVWISCKLLLSDAQGVTSEWNPYLQTISCNESAPPKPPALPDLPISIRMSDSQKHRLMGQFHEVTGRMVHHFWMTTVYYETQFVVSTMTPGLAAAAAITLLFITSVGWQKANPFLQNILS
jgi:hypothetical protein